MFDFLTFAMVAPAGAEGAEGAQGSMPMIIMMVALFAAMYFFTIRPQKKQQKQDDLCTIEDILQHIGSKAEQVQSFAGLVNWAVKNGALQTVLDRAYFFRTYIDSMNLNSRCTKKNEYVIDQLEQQTLFLAKENDDLRERLGFAEQSASLYYKQLFGEEAPASYTWGGAGRCSLRRRRKL